MKKEFKNLFEAAGKLAQSKRADSTHPPSHNDLEKRFFECRTMHDDINKGLEFAFTFSALDHHAFHSFFEKAQNFSQTEWKAVQEGKSNIETMLQNLKNGQVIVHHEETQPIQEEQGQEEQSQEPATPQPEPPVPAEPSKEAETKPKKRLPHRRQWLDMH